jgi:hypothetical protein
MINVLPAPMAGDDHSTLPIFFCQTMEPFAG